MEQKQKIIFRMSESGKCPRALSAQLLNMEGEAKPDYVSRAANEGNWHEDRIANTEMAFDRQMEIELDYPSFKLVGHIDGKIAWDADNPQILLEIKTMSQYEFDRWMRGRFNEFPNYAAQITCYMEATGLNECLYIVKNRNSGYEDRQVLTEKPVHMTEIIGKLTEVTNYVASKQLIPREADLNSLECKRCEYKKLCIPEPEKLTPVEETRLNIAVDRWRDGKHMIEEGQKLMESSKAIFEQHTKATNQVKWQFNKLAIQLTHLKESKIYPKAKLLKVFTEEQLEPASEVKEAYDQLRIIDLERNNEKD